MATSLPPGDPQSVTSPDSADAIAEWQPFPQAAGRLRAVSGGIAGLITALPLSAAVAGLLDDLATSIAALAIVTPGLMATGAWLGHARWRRSRWKLDDRGLHVMRGWLWRAEILIPRSRVQHLDVERGPLERHFGLATLVVHTAATDTSALRQPGFADHDAVALRDALIPAASRDGDAL